MFIFGIQKIALLTLIPAFLSTSLVGSPVQNPQITGNTEKKSPCRIEVSVAHLSTYLKEFKNTRAVKVNADSICNKPLQNLTIYVEIHKKGWLNDHLVDTFQSSEYSYVAANRKTIYEGAFVICKNLRSTEYYGIAYSRALEDGIWEFAPKAKSIKTLPLRCGT
jgi:hypothetical protein